MINKSTGAILLSLLVLFLVCNGVYSHKGEEQEVFRPISLYAQGQVLIPARRVANFVEVPINWVQEERLPYISQYPLGGVMLAGVYYAVAQDLAQAIGADYSWSEKNKTGYIDTGERLILLEPMQSPQFHEASPMVYLTFDDGPNDSIPDILNILDYYNVKAVFFLVGENVLRYVDYGNEIITRGHQIGNHSYSHPQLSTLTEEEVFAELATTENIFQSRLNKKSRIFRPPYGDYNYLVTRVAAELGLQQILWDINPGDYLLPGTDKMVEVIKDGLKPNARILLHCKMATAQALPAIIELVWSQGFTFALFP